MKKFLLIPFSFFLFTFSGCGPFWVDPYITVKGSPLNWVQIHYYNLNKKPPRRISVYLSESGYVEIKKGKSDLISDDFAKKYKTAEFSDVKSQRIAVDPGHIRQLEQHLVNYGLLDREKNFKGADEDGYTRFMAVKANIDSVTYSDNDNIFEVDPDLAEQLLDVIREFDSPAIR